MGAQPPYPRYRLAVYRTCHGLAGAQASHQLNLALVARRSSRLDHWLAVLIQEGGACTPCAPLIFGREKIFKIVIIY